jgi:hypothetical protein
MLSQLFRGTSGLVVAYVLATSGLLLAMWKVGNRRALVGSPILAIPICIAVLIAWSVIGSILKALFGPLPDTVGYVLTTLFIPSASGLAGVLWLKSWPEIVTLKRGTRLLPAARGETRRGEQSHEMLFAGQPVPEGDETKHFKILGTTGTGKSTVIRQLLEQAINRGDRAVIADPDGSYLERFYEPTRDVILNPFDKRSARWDLLGEVIQPHDADQLARALIPDYEGSDRNWRQYARTFLTAILRQLHRIEEHDLAKLYYLLILAPPAELRDLLSMTPAGPFLSTDNARYFDSVRSITNVHLAALEHLTLQSSGSAMSVRHWIREGRGVLFLPYAANEIAVLRYLVSTWMRLALFETMHTKEGDQKLWFVVDELDALGAIDGLKDALARLRKFGGRCVLGFQSIAQVRGTYGDAEAQTIVENCGNTLILRCSASEHGGTAEFASRLIGKREIIRRQHSRSGPTGMFGPIQQSQAQHTITEQHAVEDAVMASEIEQLPDLQGFLKIASRAEWRRISIERDRAPLR